MTIDIERTIGAVTRAVSLREVDGVSAHVITLTRRLDAPRSEVWAALTDPGRIPRWFLPISGDLRVGGKYRLRGNAGGEILECDAPSRFRITWEMQGQVSWVTVELSDDGTDATKLRLEHLAHVPAEFWDQFGPGAVGVGWDLALLGLEQHFVAQPAVTPETAEAWGATAEGKSFARRSSEAWCDASIAAGTDPAAARTAADRTTSFYTGGG